MMNRKVLFVINPVAGGKVRHIDDVIIRSHLFDDFQIVNTEYPGHAFELAKETDCDIVAAVGGDGTVNEVARGLIGSDKTLAIIPCGSGNGLALHLGIPTKVNRALRKMASGNTQKIDVALIAGHMFFCTCGVGLDADVSMAFSKSKKRGLITYIVAALRIWKNYRPKNCQLIIDGDVINIEAVLITVGNANQWGNKAFITPTAVISDGLLEVTVIEPVGTFEALSILPKLFNKQLYKHKKVRHFQGHRVELHLDNDCCAHFDGEPIYLGKNIVIEVQKEVLTVVK